MLVGGTALNGFYAGHRRSDDLDLFVKDEDAFTQTLLAVRSLKNLNANMQEKVHSNQFFKAICKLDGHEFTVDVVLDENQFREGNAILCGGGINVADIKTLFMMKAATLLSRCSEKDLYDLIWLFDNFEGASIPALFSEGIKIDGGMNAETLLYSVSSRQPRIEACDFSTDPEINAAKVFSRISRFQKQLVRDISAYLKENTKSELTAVVERFRRLK